MARNWLPFVVRGTPVVGVRIGPDRYFALVDTGARISMIAPDVSLKIGLEDVGAQAIIGITGKQESVPAVELPSVGFGNIELNPCRAAVIDVTQLGLPIDLILATDIASSLISLVGGSI